ncbi:DUF5652 family protein [Kribbella sp. NPDC054772]
MARTTWQEMSPRKRRMVVVGGAVDGVLKIAALVDLWRRPATEVRGSKVWWATALAVTNSAGLLPIVYFAYGREKPDQV